MYTKVLVLVVYNNSTTLQSTVINKSVYTLSAENHCCAAQGRHVPRQFPWEHENNQLAQLHEQTCEYAGFLGAINLYPPPVGMSLIQPDSTDIANDSSIRYF